MSVNPGQGKPISLKEVVGDVKELHAEPSSHSSVFQVASQFNTLEMISPERTPEEGVGIYSFDRTQGPACAIACGAGTVFRNYFVPLREDIGQTQHRQIDCLKEIGQALGNEGDGLWQMKNGYLMTTLSALETICTRIVNLPPSKYEDLKGKLCVGVQMDVEVTHRDSGHKVTQVFCSALPIAYNSLPSNLWEPFAQLVLEATYEATFWIALQNLKRTGIGNLFLTLVGGGAFGNHETWIRNAIETNLFRFKDAGLNISLVSYGSPSPIVAGIVNDYRRN